MEHPETYPVTKENGPRPAGDPNQCFYCAKPVGTEHESSCVCRKRTVTLEYVFKVTVTVPAAWTPEDIESHRNRSSWCADNAIEDLYTAEEKCLCGRFEAKYIGEATTDDETLFDLDRNLIEKEQEEIAEAIAAAGEGG